MAALPVSEQVPGPFLNPIEERDCSRRRKKESQCGFLPCSSSESPLKKDCDRKKGKAKMTGLEEQEGVGTLAVARGRRKKFLMRGFLQITVAKTQ